MLQQIGIIWKNYIAWSVLTITLPAVGFAENLKKESDNELNPVIVKSQSNLLKAQ
ncbi:hypothetical protein [uncultured Bartonella sp.]|uniref:hypothetical protein n=1 Tax=uncultured Bartonella sp. TaxID=104108 RepID=UPI00343F8220